MNLKKLALSVIVVGSASYLTGCTIGSSESECPGMEKGVICKGPREVMELTNNSDDLSNLFNGEKNEGKGQSTVSDSRYPAEITPPGGVVYPKSKVLHNQPVQSTTVQSAPAPRYYEPNADIPRAKDLYSIHNGQPVNPTLSAHNIQQYRSQGYKQSVVAPEPLAVLQQGKVMRITFAPYTDDNNALNLPGYVYVNVKPQTWIAGKNATDNPARIVPLEVQDAARDNMQQQQRATQAVSSNGVIRQL
ncbi:TraV family lipoprotein [Photorhabdus heterorhabditis]|uniref:TraV family lipoprotein n=1 Tax=Photorhabdus heterorhabditis TaxID=880156 RepID=UPI0015624C97|nr:TraV family lipoprotein [Photorhabdus heterorhabditis]NRN29003.1 TraV family lipoprotein [Photorhabdus heterorhabditis subsp. aluminescens]